MKRKQSKQPPAGAVRRYHHLKGIPPEYHAVLHRGKLRYSVHAQTRFATRVAAIADGGTQPQFLEPGSMQLLAVDVIGDAVVMQLWRMPHANIEQDLVLAVTDIGRVATVWVVKRDDPDGVTRARNRSAEAQRDVNALSFAFPVGKDDAAVWPVEVRAAVRRRWSAERDSTTFGLDGEPGPRRVRSAVRDDTLSDFVPARGAGPDVELSIVDEKDSAGSRSL